MTQHLDDIFIPVIEITEGWAASECATIADCDDAFAYLMAAVAGIELQIELEALKPPAEQRGEWLAKARCALKYKKAALQIVTHRRSAINAAERAARIAAEDEGMLRHIRSSLPMDQWVQITSNYVREAA